MSRKQLQMLFSNNRYFLPATLLWGSTAGYPSDSLASCYKRAVSVSLLCRKGWIWPYWFIIF